ncbi:MAG: flagellar assembly protein FliW [Bacillota bacterium]
MIVKTSRFGEVECQDEHIFSFIEGPLGFPGAKNFVIINHPGNNIFKWLQSVDDPELAFVIAEPFVFFSDYEFNLEDTDVTLLEIRDPKKVLVYTILVIPPDFKKITANLKAPIVINGDNRKGKQVVLLDERYSTKHFVFNGAMKE